MSQHQQVSGTLPAGAPVLIAKGAPTPAGTATSFSMKQAQPRRLGRAAEDGDTLASRGDPRAPIHFGVVWAGIIPQGYGISKLEFHPAAWRFDRRRAPRKAELC